jgi:uncharacterized protein
MHILITGGTGFIGKALCAELLRRGHRPTVLSRNAAQATLWLPAGVHVVSSLDQLRDEIPEAIVNLAGENLGATRWTPARKQAFIDSRVGTTARLLAFMDQCVGKPRVLVSGSAIGWYGARGDTLLDEDSAPGSAQEFQVQLFQAGENAALAAQDRGLRVCRVRIGIVLERDGGPLARMLPPFRFGLGGPLGDGRQWMSWIHRADLIALLIRLCEDETLSGAFNGTAPEPVRNRDFASALGAALGRPAALPMPGFALRLLLGEMAEMLLTGQRVLPHRIQHADFGFRYPDLDSALRAILKPSAAS